MVASVMGLAAPWLVICAAIALLLFATGLIVTTYFGGLTLSLHARRHRPTSRVCGGRSRCTWAMSAERRGVL